MKFIFFCLVIFTTFVFAQEKYKVVPLDNIFLNRKAKILSKKDRDIYRLSSFAFKWNFEDARTLRWRPQGITEFKFHNKNYLIISWYGRKKFNFDNRGVRISFVDITNKKKLAYRHVLLVDKNYKTFKGMHAGGLVCIGKKLHVPDTRKGKKIIHIFSINKIKLVPRELKKLFFNYKYILQEERFYYVPIKPSFMSYDFSRKKILIGTFNKCLSKNTLSCMLDKKNTLSWYSPNNVNINSKFCFPYFSEMQGAASLKLQNSRKSTLFITSSYGKYRDSYLHIVDIDTVDCYSNGVGMTNYRSLKFPPGLEDLCITNDLKTMWLLTEFFSNDKKINVFNNRVVFSIKINDILLKNQGDK